MGHSSLQHRHTDAFCVTAVHCGRSNVSYLIARRKESWKQRVVATLSDAHLAPSSSQAVHAASQSPLVDRTYERNWMCPLEGRDHPVAACRPIVCLGKFDALHKGHQSLAAAALALGGSPVLLSFSGMGAVLGWQPRKPLVAPCDRPRVLDLWAQQLSQQQQQQQHELDVLHSTNSSSGEQEAAVANQQPPQQQQQAVVPIRQHYLPFAAIRSMSPEAFVQLLQQELGAAGVVAGINYRFGYRAAGDSALLQQLCNAAGLATRVVELVGAAEPGAVGVVSSSKIREMLSACRIEAARKSLGRPYRLVAAMQLPALPPSPPPQQQQQQPSPGSGDSSSNSACPDEATLFVGQAHLLNQHPGPGVYLCSLQLYLGASGHDDVLQLQRSAAAAASEQQPQAADDGSCGDCSSPTDMQLLQGLHVPGSSCNAAITASKQQVVVTEGGLVLPQNLMSVVANACSTVTYSSSRSSSSNSISGSSPSGFGLLPGDGNTRDSSANSGTATQQSTTTTSSSSSSTRVGSISSTSKQCAPPGASRDPCCWDTDDNDTGSDAEDESAAAGMPALLVLDFERCLQQTCSTQGSQTTSA